MKKNRLKNYFWSTDYAESLTKKKSYEIDWKNMNNPFIADEGYFNFKKEEASKKEELVISKPKLVLGIYIICCAIYCTYSIAYNLVSLLIN